MASKWNSDNYQKYHITPNANNAVFDIQSKLFIKKQLFDCTAFEHSLIKFPKALSCHAKSCGEKERGGVNTRYSNIIVVPLAGTSQLTAEAENYNIIWAEV